MDKILEDREKRYNQILNLIEKHKLPVLCGKINYPGNDKNTQEVNIAFTILMKRLKDSYYPWIEYLEILNGFDGPALLCVINLNVFEAKEISILLEERNKIGRIFDIDIYKTDGTSVSRPDINLKPRKCLICNMDGRICMKSGKHSLEEVLEAVNNIIKAHGEI